MAEQYDNNNTFTLWKNDRKESDAQPDYRGVMQVDGKDKEIACWIREAKTTGKKFLSGRIQEPYKASSNNAAVEGESQSDDVPF